MSHTPSDDHFVHNPDLDLLAHRPHKSLLLLFNAVTATAVFRIWPTLLFMGGWSAGIVLINVKTEAELKVPNTMLTVLGVLLGLTLSYRTSSAYDRYWEGRRLWSQIILASRSWARIVWIHCPDTLVASAPTEPMDQALDETRAVIEKATMVRMCLAYSVAVKHYLRGEEGIFYEDLYHLVRFIPSLDLPTGIPSGIDASIASDPTSRHILRQDSVDSAKFLQSSSQTKSMTSSNIPLRPARNPPKFRWSETFPFRFFVTSHQRRKASGRKAMQERMKEAREGGGVGQNVPLEVTMFMSAWVAAMQKRKTIDVPTINSLLASLQSMSEALSSLERILTTPIPWSYNAHIWEVTWVYCLLLPFQLYSSGFGWITIPAVVITSYIVVGFAAIGEEIENPFGYDKNDLNLCVFCAQLAQEIDAFLARPFAAPEDWVFSDKNQIFWPAGVGAGELQGRGMEAVRRGLAEMGGMGGLRARSRTPAAV